MPRRSSGPSSTRAMSLSSTGVPPSTLTTMLLEVVDALEIAAAAHHELVLGKLERAAADVHVAVADDLAHLWTAGCRASACGRDR